MYTSQCPLWKPFFIIATTFLSSSLGTLFPLSFGRVLAPDQRWLPRPVLPHCCIKCGPRLEGNGPISLKGYWWKHHLCNVGQFWTRWLPDTVKRFCFSFSNPRSECHKMSDSKPCSCVCLFSINQPYVLILKSRSALIFSCRIQESVFCETSRLALRDPGEINGQSRTRHTILRPRKTLCCFPGFLFARSSVKCKNKFASHLSSKIKNGK